MSYSLVWFKRDLRWEDHEALAQAAQSGPVRCVYVLEPAMWLQPDSALQHFEFIKESLQALDSHLRTLGGCIEIHTGNVRDVFNQLWQESPFSNLYSHEETGNGFTYARDLEVASWCKSKIATYGEVLGSVIWLRPSAKQPNYHSGSLHLSLNLPCKRPRI